MRKPLIALSLTLTLASLSVWAMSFGGHCELEGEKTHKAAIPVVEALAAYAEKNGIPNLDSFDQIEGMPYELKPCSERPDLMECEVLKNGYYFQVSDEYYSIRMWEGYPSGLGLAVIHNYTDCEYSLVNDGKIDHTYSQPACSLIGRCAGWFRQ